MQLADLIASGQVSITVEELTVSSITTDPRVNTRPVYKPWVDQHIPLFDANKLGVPIVSARTDGTRVWLDGQNRGALLKAVGWGDQLVECRVFRGLTLKQEAELFLGHNDNRRVGAVYKFQARVTAGDRDAVAIDKIVRAAGWRIHDQNTGTTIPAVAALERVFHGDPRDQRPDGVTPGFALEKTLRVINDAWGFKPDAANGEILRGIGSLFNRYWGAVDVAVLAKKLATYPGGPAGLLGDARGRRQYQGGSVAACVSESLVDLYNKGRRSQLLAPWRG